MFDVGSKRCSMGWMSCVKVDGNESYEEDGGRIV